MKRFLFAVAVVALFGAVSYAEDKPAVAPAPVPAAGTVVSPTYSYEQPTQQRRGLFSRLRNRNTTSNYSTAPLMTAPAPVPAATPMPPTAPAPTPMPMPGSTAAPKSGMVVQASGNLPAGTYTTTDGTIVQIGGTTPATTNSTSTRTGLFGRMRNR